MWAHGHGTTRAVRRTDRVQTARVTEMDIREPTGEQRRGNAIKYVQAGVKCSGSNNGFGGRGGSSASLGGTADVDDDDSA